MPGEMSLADIQQKLESSVLMYNKKPILFQKIAANLQTARVFNLMAQKEEEVEFEEKLFTPPIPRIGMVNIGGTCFYMKRIPIRRYKLGLSTENTKILDLPCEVGNSGALRQELRGLRTKELATTLLKKYPTLKQAFRTLSQFEGCIAFDKQFAVTHEQTLIYKDKLVGRHDFKSISFDEGYEHLSQLVNV